jgi:CheY-like chemotaxis protein
MIDSNAAASRLPLVLVVDPVAASRQTLWRLLSPFCAVLEAPGAQRAQDWLTLRPNIDALVVQQDLPDLPGREFLASLASARVPVASRAVLVTRPLDTHDVFTKLSGCLFTRDIRKADALRREAARLAS